MFRWPLDHIEVESARRRAMYLMNCRHLHKVVDKIESEARDYLAIRDRVKTSSSVSLPPSLSSSVPHSRKLNELRALAPRGTCCSPLPRSKIPRAIMRRPAEWAAGTGNSLPAACKSLFMGVWGHPSAAGHDHAMMHAAPVCVAPARCCARALYSSVMHLPAAACTHNSWQPGGVRGSPSVRNKAHPLAQKEAIHAHRGRR
jgi:hypothetical protein